MNINEYNSFASTEYWNSLKEVICILVLRESNLLKAKFRRYLINKLDKNHQTVGTNLYNIRCWNCQLLL